MRVFRSRFLIWSHNPKLGSDGAGDPDRAAGALDRRGHGRSALYRFLVGGKFPMRFRFAAAYDGDVMTALESVRVAPLKNPCRVTALESMQVAVLESVQVAALETAP